MPAKRDQDFFWEGVDRGEFLAQKCASCDKVRHPPLPSCGECGSADWASVHLCGRGVINSWIISQHPSLPDPDPKTVVLVDLEEGVRFVSCLIDRENVDNGAPVAMEFGLLGERMVPLFRTTSVRASEGRS